jgi:hypothetical protein
MREICQRRVLGCRDRLNGRGLQDQAEKFLGKGRCVRIARQWTLGSLDMLEQVDPPLRVGGSMIFGIAG